MRIDNTSHCSHSHVGTKARPAKLIGVDPDETILERARRKLADANVLPILMSEVGFSNVEETDVVPTVTGSISLYRAVRSSNATTAR